MGVYKIASFMFICMCDLTVVGCLGLVVSGALFLLTCLVYLGIVICWFGVFVCYSYLSGVYYGCWLICFVIMLL